MNFDFHFRTIPSCIGLTVTKSRGLLFDFLVMWKSVVVLAVRNLNMSIREPDLLFLWILLVIRVYFEKRSNFE